jgi:TIR domain-containing protein
VSSPVGPQRPRPEGWHVFLSYRRGTAAEHAKRVQRTLESAGLRVFIDERDIPLDAEFPREIADALLESQILIAFLDAEYFRSQWCLYELQVALAPLRRDPAADAAHVLPVLIAEDADEVLSHLPPALARNSCSGPDPEAILRRVQARLEIVHGAIAERLSADDDAVRTLRLGGGVPPAGSLSEIPGFRRAMPLSLKDRFSGRALDLWTIFHELATVPPHSAPRSCCISGPPGMGKSQLAAEFAWRYGRRHFQGGIVWIDAAAPQDGAESQIGEALAGLHGAALEGLTPHRVLQNACAKGRVLWIVDGITSSDARGRGALDVWCPVRADVTLLCTSRGARPIDVDMPIDLVALSETAAVDLLTGPGVRKSLLNDREWAAIARWVGCVPQALEIQYAVLKSGFREPRDLLTAAQRTSNPVEEIDLQFAELRSELPTGSLSGISETFGIWYENLSGERDLVKAAHLLARSVGNPLMKQIVPRPALAKLANRSWVQRIESEHGETSRETWRMNDLIRSYLLARSPDPALEVVRLARVFLGFEPGGRTVMIGLPRGGLDILSNVKSVGAESLEDVALEVFERAASSPNDIDLAGVAEVLGALRDQSVQARLARSLQTGTDPAWHLALYVRYVQGFARPAAEPKILPREDGKFAAELLLSSPMSVRDRELLLAPLLAVLRESPLTLAGKAAVYMAQIPLTRDAVEAELLRQIDQAPGRAGELAARIIAAGVKSAKAYAVYAVTDTEGPAELRIECLREAVRLEPSLFLAHVALAKMLARQPSGGDAEQKVSTVPEPSEPRLSFDTFSVSIPAGWIHEVRAGSTLVAHPPGEGGPPPINLVIKWSPPRPAGVDRTAIEYLQTMSIFDTLEDLAVRYVTGRPEAALLMSFRLRVQGQALRQCTLLLRDERQEVSATVTHREETGVSPETIEQILFSIRLAAQ